ncbi:TetR/AcrR family transcriptional regulator [Spirillospora sp. CA-108201]
MVRLTRVQQQARTRAAVLAAAVEEFAEHGFAGAKVDRIADRAELTRGAVYSNFASKQALYLAVLLDRVQRSAADGEDPVGELDLTDAAEAFARVRLERLPLAGETTGSGRPATWSLTGVFDDAAGRSAMAELARLEGLLLALALESCRTNAGRRVRLAELILTLLHGAGHLAETAPGFSDPFDVARACRHLAELDADDAWNPPHLPYIAAPRLCLDSWTPPGESTDAITGRPVGFDDDGVIVVLGTGRLSAAEEAVRAVRAGEPVTVALVTDDPAEIGALVRLRITGLAVCLRRAFGSALRLPMRLVLDERAALATAVGAGTAENTEVGVRVRGGKIIARAQGRGAGHAAATAPALAEPAETDGR